MPDLDMQLTPSEGPSSYPIVTVSLYDRSLAKVAMGLVLDCQSGRLSHFLFPTLYGLPYLSVCLTTTSISYMPVGTVRRFKGPFPLLSEFFKEGRPDFTLLNQGLNCEELRNPFVVCSCPIARRRRIGENISMRALGVTSHWWGTVVILKFADPSYNQYEDVVSRDVLQLRALLRSLYR